MPNAVAGTSNRVVSIEDHAPPREDRLQSVISKLVAQGFVVAVPQDNGRMVIPMRAENGLIFDPELEEIGKDPRHPGYRYVTDPRFREEETIAYFDPDRVAERAKAGWKDRMVLILRFCKGNLERVAVAVNTILSHKMQALNEAENRGVETSLWKRVVMDPKNAKTVVRVCSMFMAILLGGSFFLRRPYAG